ncbi:MAG: hypothetical protein JST09_20040, partial [Bacteroidetes bacterium]|nr:hypothetical protein [Bacteroidota bacterium]
MKKAFLIIIAGIITLSSCVKNPDLFNNDSLSSITGDDHGGRSGSGTKINASAVPAAVSSAFSNEFGGAGSIEWKLLDNGNYKVQFILNNVKWEAVYNAGGSRLSLE